MRHLGRMPVTFGLNMIAQALEERRKEAARREWLALFPWMTAENFKSFEQYYEEKIHFSKLAVTPQSKDAILADAKAIREKAKRKRQTV